LFFQVHASRPAVAGLSHTQAALARLPCHRQARSDPTVVAAVVCREHAFSPDARGVVKTIALNDPRVETVVEALPHELEFRINR
jgi:hypothetical protein